MADAVAHPAAVRRAALLVGALSPMNAVAMNAEQERPMWRPSRDEQMAALEILLASPLNSELRRLLRQREYELATRKDMQ